MAVTKRIVTWQSTSTVCVLVGPPSSVNCRNGKIYIDMDSLSRETSETQRAVLDIVSTYEARLEMKPVDVQGDNLLQTQFSFWSSFSIEL